MCTWPLTLHKDVRNALSFPIHNLELQTYELCLSGKTNKKLRLNVERVWLRDMGGNKKRKRNKEQQGSN